jgi:hypothetical protein
MKIIIEKCLSAAERTQTHDIVCPPNSKSGLGPRDFIAAAGP